MPGCNPASSRKLSRAFTLVELLVVVAIVALLVSILLPSLARAREQAKSSKCLANLFDLMRSSVVYANTDSSEYLIPVMGTLRDVDHLSASRRAWGGKSGLHTLIGPDPELPDDAQMFSTKNGFGPGKRPLNQFLYKDNYPHRSFDDDGQLIVSHEEAIAEEKLDMPVYKCPSDVGYQSGRDGNGIFLYGRVPMRDFRDPTPLYDVAGNSYATDSLLTIAGSDDTVQSWGVYLHEYADIPSPYERYVYLEGNGFYAAFWNQANVCGCAGGTDDLEDYAWGWHGNIREHNASFADGHAAKTLFEIRTDVTGFDSSTNTVVHSGEFEMRGGTAYNFDYHPSEQPAGIPAWDHASAATFCIRGPDWKNSTQPYPATWTPGLLWNAD